MMNFLSDLGDFSFLFHKKFNSPLKKTSPMNWFRTFFCDTREQMEHFGE